MGSPPRDHPHHTQPDHLTPGTFWVSVGNKVKPSVVDRGVTGCEELSCSQRSGEAGEAGHQGKLSGKRQRTWVAALDLTLVLWARNLPSVDLSLFIYKI